MSLGQIPAPRVPAHPHPDDVELHKQQHPVEDHQEPREAEAQLREADGVVIELDELDGLSDEGQGPIDEQSCGGERGGSRMPCVPLQACRCAPLHTRQSHTCLRGTLDL